MCLAKVYREKVSPENLCMDHVLTIENQNEMVVLEDIFGRTMKIAGIVRSSNYESGVTVIQEMKKRIE